MTAPRRRLLALAVSIAVLLGGCSSAGEGGGTQADDGPPATSPGVASRSPAFRPPAVPPALSATASAPASPPATELAATVWVAGENGRAVALVDVGSASVVRTVEVPGRPHNAAATSGGGAAFTLPGEGRLVLVDATGRLTPVDLGGSPHDVKAAGDRLVVANAGGSRLDLITAAGAPTGRIGLRASPHDVAVAPDGRTAWVTFDASDAIAVVDLEALAVRRSIATGKRPHDLLFSPGGEEVWVTDLAGDLDVYTASGEPVGAVPLGQEAHHLAFTSDASEVWVTDSPGRRVYVVEVRSRRVVARLAMAGSPHHVALTGGRAAVADNTNAALVLFDVRSRQPAGQVTVPAGPHGASAAQP